MSEHLPDVKVIEPCPHGHAPGLCRACMQAEITRLQDRVAELERHLNKAEIERAWAVGKLREAMPTAVPTIGPHCDCTSFCMRQSKNIDPRLCKAARASETTPGAPK